MLSDSSQLRMQRMTELAKLVKSQEEELRELLAKCLQDAREQGDAWFVEHAFWIAKHMRTRGGFATACLESADVTAEVQPKTGEGVPAT